MTTVSQAVHNSQGGESSSEDGILTCPYCQDSVTSLIRVDTGMRLRLQEVAQLSPAPESVCEGCHRILSKTVSKGAVLRAEQQAKEQNRILLWKNRVALVKQAKALLAKKNYSDAAVAYEKYLRVLEIVYEKKPGELNPEMFSNQTRAQEITVISTVYWDLMRIYDTHPRYKDRQMKTADKLAQFVRFTPIFGHIMRKAESQTRQAKNPEAFRRFLKLSNAKRPRCFIATAAFNGQRTQTVEVLCQFRDHYLKNTRTGRKFITCYYAVSPSLAATLDRYPLLKPAVRKVLTFVAESKFVRNNLNQ